MGIALRSFEIPKKLECDAESLTGEYGKFIAEPFERGYGVTIGNSLRRVLLSSLEGAAATSIKIDGVAHEFGTLPGVVEDVTEIVLNVKSLVLRSHTRASKTLHIEVNQKQEITAKDIVTDDTVEIINPNLHLATLTKNVKFSMELEVQKGRGYVPADRNKKEGQPIGVIAIDSIFTPVKRVNFHVEDTRVGQMTDYDKLIIEVWTNGSISPKDAMLYASNILQRHLDVFVNFGKLPDEDLAVEPSNDKEDELYKRFAQPVSEMELSVRSANCLREAHIKTIGDLVKKTEMEMLKYRNFGKKSLTEITNILKEMNLGFGLTIDEKKLKQYSGEPE
ncbi:MAG: DNA-directed RNA polymerase subunit alpha [Candidatus Omnitrophica bacterium CG07_land_8_20_14_0_80_50_8]|nr:MAG: DNA-directed RNA polymerase subunit alpha [Candidatus Omnitrophica bacterium CG1_02_49_16]PIU40443.1 MAG: DNA-directed RNA polymerase subunit alpha [Candidatus Omnitrophica bacterium CG07_land_8_20_14_0_80_50_8]